MESPESKTGLGILRLCIYIGIVQIALGLH